MDLIKKRDAMEKKVQDLIKEKDILQKSVLKEYNMEFVQITDTNLQKEFDNNTPIREISNN
jgi:sulfur carrier protein ThiS